MALVRISSAMLNRNGRSGHPGLVPDIQAKAFNASSLRMMLAVGFKSIKLYGTAALDNMLSKVQNKFSS